MPNKAALFYSYLLKLQSKKKMKLAILGSGFISRFYADALVSQRRKDVITMVYSRNEANAKKFAFDYNIPNYTTSITECVNHKEVDAVIIGLSNEIGRAHV